MGFSYLVTEIYFFHEAKGKKKGREGFSYFPMRETRVGDLVRECQKGGRRKGEGKLDYIVMSKELGGHVLYIGKNVGVKEATIPRALIDEEEEMAFGGTRKEKGKKRCTSW